MCIRDRNYSKTIHLVFPSAVKYNQAVTDFVAVDNPESVPNISVSYTHLHSFSREGEVFQVEHRLLKAFEQPLSDEQLKSITERFDLTKYEARM